jgi:hypothetical protein
MAVAQKVLNEVLASMKPVLNPGVYAFVHVPSGVLDPSIKPLATMREVEGLSVVVEVSQLEAVPVALENLTIHFRADFITLGVHSDLSAVGLTACVAHVLANAGISCNVIAGVFHDHLFVPEGRGAEALALLEELSQGAVLGCGVRSLNDGSEFVEVLVLGDNIE